MGSFHVNVEGPVERSPDAFHRLAELLSQKYGVPGGDLVARLSRGKVRVKSNLDRTEADMCARELAQFGARVSIEDASATTSGSMARTGGKPQLQSGLAAAFSGEHSAASLGALDQGDGALSLASLDGSDSKDTPVDSVGPAHPGLSANFGPPVPKLPPPTPGAPASKPRPKDIPLDLFAPPDAGSEDFSVEVAADEPVGHGPALPRTTTGQSSPGVALPRTTTGQRAAGVALPRTTTAQGGASVALPRTTTGQRPLPLGHEPAMVVASSSNASRVRFAAGVVLAIVLGFIPAHFIAAVRERSAYAAIDREVVTQQLNADTTELYQALDGYRRVQLENKQSKRTMIALTSMAIWAVVGGAIAYVWFRRIPWDRIKPS
ncbi:MAG: hypothetical protein AB7P03_05640 [Kofleriaceae bacterium]